jgi:peptidyl-prolyl cis-trans isomerase SurA
MARFYQAISKIRRFVWVFIWLLGSLGGYNVYGDEVVDRIVAVVNDDIITFREVQEEMRPYLERIKAVGYDPEVEQQMIYRVRKDIVKKLVDQKITDQEIKRYRISVSDEDIDSNIEQIKANKLWTDEDLRKALEQEGLTMESYRQRMKEDALRSRLINTAVRSNIVITKEDVAAYYADNIESYAGELKYHLRNIIMRVPDDAGTEEKQAVRDKMEGLHAKLVNGDAFVSMAKQYTESSMAINGGDLGVLAYKDFAPQLKEALDGLSKGAFTTVLETDQGYQIFYIEDILKEKAKLLEEAASEIEEILFKSLSEKAFAKWIEDLRESSHIKITL